MGPMTNPMGMEYLPTLRMIGPFKSGGHFEDQNTPASYRFRAPSIGGSKILSLKFMVNVEEYSIHRTSGFFIQFLNRVTLF